MFDTINGARLACKRIKKTLGIKDSEARRLVAIAAGCQDWHDLEHRVGHASFPSRPSREEMITRIARTAPGIDAARTADALAPDGGLKWSDLPDMEDMEIRAARGLGQRSSHLSPAVRDNGDVRTLSVTAYDAESEEYQRVYDLVDAGVRVAGGCVDQIGANVHDLRWELRRDGVVVAIAAGTLYDHDGHGPHFGGGGDAAHAGMLCDQVLDSDVGDGETLAAILGAEEGPSELEFAGVLFVLTHLHVRAKHRRQGLAARLARTVASEIMTRSSDDGGTRVVVDLDAVRGKQPTPSLVDPHRLSDPAPWDLTIDDHEAMVRRLLRGSIGKALAIDGHQALVHRADGAGDAFPRQEPPERVMHTIVIDDDGTMRTDPDGPPASWGAVAVAIVNQRQERRLEVDEPSAEQLRKAAASLEENERVDEEMLALAIREAQRRLAGKDGLDPVLEYALAKHGRAMLAIVRPDDHFVGTSHASPTAGGTASMALDALVDVARAGEPPQRDLRPHDVDGELVSWAWWE